MHPAVAANATRLADATLSATCALSTRPGDEDAVDEEVPDVERLPVVVSEGDPDRVGACSTVALLRGVRVLEERAELLHELLAAALVAAWLRDAVPVCEMLKVSLLVEN